MSYTKRIVTATLSFALILFACPVLGAPLTLVPEDQPTIQAGIAAAFTAVSVAPGTYVENIDFHGKGIRVYGREGAEATVIDGNGCGAVVSFVSGETASAVIEGFTITNGTGKMDVSSRYGGGIACWYTSPTIRGCIITDNSADCSGGIDLLYSSATIVNCTITNNSAANWAGGIFCAQSSPTITNCTLSRNSAGLQGGGIHSSDSSPTITNCILWDDDAPEGPEIYVFEGTPVVTYSDVQGGWPGAGNLALFPCFVDAILGDFHIETWSPCIDAGTDAGVYEDIDYDARPQGAGFDMGSDENVDCWDLDGDHYPDEACGGDDCDDTDPAVNPSAEEVCGNGVDDDCDGVSDLDYPCVGFTAPVATTVPTIDGVIDPGEWDDAYSVDISLSGAPVWLYVKVDEESLYVAIDDQVSTSLISGGFPTQSGIYFDENNDDSWPPAGGEEGNFWLLWGESGASTMFRGIYTTGEDIPIEPAPGVEADMSGITGHIQHEWRISFEWSHLNASLYDTIGLNIFSFDGESEEKTGEWPLDGYAYSPSTFVDVQLGCPDDDGDGYADEACGGDDCDDTDPDVSPGAIEVCDNLIDDDCDGILDTKDPDCMLTKLAFIRHRINDNQYLNIYDALTEVGGEINPLVASDTWIGNVGTNHEIMFMTGGDTDGDWFHELIFIRLRTNGNQYLNIYNPPIMVDGDINPLIASDTWIGNIGTNNEITHLAAGDVDGDLSDELIFIRHRINDNQYLNIYDFPTVVGGEINPLLASDTWIGNVGTNNEITHMVVGDTTGNGIDELIFIRLRTNGNQYLNIYSAPTEVGSDINPLIASDTWIGNLGTNNEITHLAAGDTDGDLVDELIFIRHRTNGNQYLNIYNAPLSVGGEINPLVASDTWIGNIGTNNEITHMAVSR